MNLEVFNIAAGSGKPRRASETKTTLFVRLSECTAGRCAERHEKVGMGAM